MKKTAIFILLLCGMATMGMAQEAPPSLSFFEPADTFHSKRFWVAAGGGAVVYGTVSIGLYRAWYKNYEQTSFHFFNDYGEWMNIDKFGHLFTAYHEARGGFLGANWAGVRHNRAVWAGVGLGMFLQGTLEMMDAYSAKWGFSLSDMAFNAGGVSVFALQEAIWKEQRITIKFSASPVVHSNNPLLSTDGRATSSPNIRADDLFGSTYAQRFLKDYNGQVLWASFNPASFVSSNPAWLPKWLNIAVGYGAENMYGGYANSWTENDAIFKLSADKYPRYRQYYLSLDVDFTRIPTKNKFLKSLLHVVNFIKVPSPTVEWSRGRLKFHSFYW